MTCWRDGLHGTSLSLFPTLSLTEVSYDRSCDL